MWTYLRSKKFHGYAWRRQFSVGNYILSFFCPSEKLAIELDRQGEANGETDNNEAERTANLQKLGIRVLHFEGRQVFDSWAGIEKSILAAIEKRDSK